LKSEEALAPDPVRRRPTMTEKQLGAAVSLGRKIVFAREGYPDIEGYLAGLDDNNFFVVSVGNPREDGSQVVASYLLRRTTSPWQRIMVDSLDRESLAARNQVEDIVKPFRKWMQSYLFPQENR
jgi:hypothetical protein